MSNIITKTESERKRALDFIKDSDVYQVFRWGSTALYVVYLYFSGIGEYISGYTLRRLMNEVFDTIARDNAEEDGFIAIPEVIFVDKSMILKIEIEEKDGSYWEYLEVVKIGG